MYGGGWQVFLVFNKDKKKGRHLLAPEAFSAMAILPYPMNDPKPLPLPNTTTFAVGRGVLAVKQGKGVGPRALEQSMLFAKTKVRISTTPICL